MNISGKIMPPLIRVASRAISSTTQKITPTMETNNTLLKIAGAAATGIGAAVGTALQQLKEPNAKRDFEALAQKGIAQIVISHAGPTASFLVTGFAIGLLAKSVISGTGSAVNAIHGYFFKPNQDDSTQPS